MGLSPNAKGLAKAGYDKASFLKEACELITLIPQA